MLKLSVKKGGGGGELGNGGEVGLETVNYTGTPCAHQPPIIGYARTHASEWKRAKEREKVAKITTRRLQGT